MDAAYFSAFAALAGSVIGGATSFAAAWITQRQQANVQLLLQEKTRRQELYKQFIEEASKVYLDALIHDQVAVPPLVNLYSAISRMRVVSSPNIPDQAEKVVRMIVDTYFSPNKTLPELHAMMNSGALDPLRSFSEACRDELNALAPTPKTKVAQSEVSGIRDQGSGIRNPPSRPPDGQAQSETSG